MKKQIIKTDSHSKSGNWIRVYVIIDGVKTKVDEFRHTSMYGFWNYIAKRKKSKWIDRLSIAMQKAHNFK